MPQRNYCRETYVWLLLQIYIDNMKSSELIYLYPLTSVLMKQSAGETKHNNNDNKNNNSAILFVFISRVDSLWSFMVRLRVGH